MDDIGRIIHRCVKGDREAMELLYKTYSLRMMRVIRRYIPDPLTAEDILHDGFIVIFTRIGDVKDTEKLEYWMASVMKNLCISYLSQLDITSLLNEDIDVPDLPELDDLLGYDELMTLINRLPDGYRNVFKLAVLDGKSHREIGKILGIEPHSSSSQLYHARLLLRKMIIERKRELGLLGLLLPLCFAAWHFMGHNDEAAPVSAAYDHPAPELLIAAAPPTGMQVVSPQSPSVVAPAVVHPGPQVVEMPVADSIAGPTEMESEEIRLSHEYIAQEASTSEADSTLYDDLLLPDDSGEYLAMNLLPRGRRDDSWSISPGVNLDPSHLSFSSGMPEPGISAPDYTSPPWGDANSPGASLSPMRPDIPNPFPVYDTEVDHHLPLTFGVNVSKRLSDLVSVESGLTLTLLRSDISYKAFKREARRDVRTYYLGLPLRVSLRLFHTGSFSTYAVGGGTVEFPVGMRVSSEIVRNNGGKMPLPEISTRPQFSLTGGLGLQYNITPSFGIYAEPSLRYNFNNRSTLPTYWQDHPTMFNIPMGLRITW